MGTAFQAILELRFENAKRKASEYAMEGLTAPNPQKRCYYEIEMAYYMGKAEAYAEMIALLSDNRRAILEMRELLEKTADEIIQLHSLKLMSGSKNIKSSFEGFEEGVTALKQRLLRLIDPESLEVQFLESTRTEMEDKEGSL